VAGPSVASILVRRSGACILDSRFFVFYSGGHLNAEIWIIGIM